MFSALVSFMHLYTLLVTNNRSDRQIWSVTIPLRLQRCSLHHGSWMVHTRCLESGTSVQRMVVTSCYICTCNFVQAMLDCYLLFKLSSERLCKPSCCNAARGTRATSGVDWSCNSMWLYLSMSSVQCHCKYSKHSISVQYRYSLIISRIRSFK